MEINGKNFNLDQVAKGKQVRKENLIKPGDSQTMKDKINSLFS